MTKEEARDKIQSAILDTLRESGLSLEGGVSAMMNAVLNILSTVSQVIGARKREFIKMVLSQILNQI